MQYIGPAKDSVDFLVNRLIITPQNGVTVHYDGRRIDLDPVRSSKADHVFISHAHIDHMQGVDFTENIVTSEETVFLAKKRGFNLQCVKDTPPDLQLIDSGHILGSRGLLIGGKIFYTGDFAIRPRAFMAGGKTVECSVLILESTFGRRDYVFPPVAETLRRVNHLISDLFARGIPVILMGYSLGKAQILSYLFSSWDPIYIQQPIMDMNQAYIERGVDLRDDLISYSAAEDEGLLRKKPWILLASMSGGRSGFLAGVKKKYGAVTIAFSGWAAEPRFKYMRNVDYAFPLSDHCDFNDLLDLVKRCDPYKVYTVHGFAEEFASHLRSLGFDAQPLKNGQRSISEYFFED